MCRSFGTGKYPQEKCDVLCPPEIKEEEKLESDTPGVQYCQLKDEDECWVYFTYEYDENAEVVIKRQKKKVCPEAVNVFAIVGGVVGGIVAVGLFLLLIWKLLTFIHDSREFAKFEAERQNAKWDTGENPIYKQATSTFKNPTYSGH
jgi:protocadherin alpha